MMRAILLAAVCSVAFATASPAQVPAALTMPADKPLFTVSAKGVQIYECRQAAGAAPAWSFREPRAELMLNGKAYGRHYAGPTWESADGSRITGKAVANQAAPAPTDIPWLRLAVASASGTGDLAKATAVQRINTQGGVLAGPCSQVGAVQEVPYGADYVFLRDVP